MKKYISLILCFFSLTFSLAQEHIKVHYISQTSYEISKDEKRDQFTEALEEAMKRIQEFELTIDENESTFKSIEKIRNELPKGKVSISFGVANSILYKDVLEQIYIRTTTLDGYLEKDSLEQLDWKLSRDKNKILNYEVRKATATDGVDELTAWYAPELAFKTGPEEYWGLPGLILKLEIISNNNSKQKIYYLADAIESVSPKEPLDIPSNGTMVSSEEIDKMNKEKMEYFKSMSSEGVDTAD